jgi:hypothetical protein
MAERTVVTKVSNAVLYSDGTVKLENVRLSFPHIGTPQEQKNDAGDIEKSYGLVAMLPKETHVAAKDLIKKIIQDLAAKNEAKVATDKWFLADGDDKERAEYEDNYIVSASDRKNRPSARNRDGTVMTPDEADDKFYGGCWANVLIRPWYFSGKAKNGKTYPKRVCAGLVGVQFLRDDESFGEGRVNDDGVFDAVEGGGGNGFDDDDGGL